MAEASRQKARRREAEGNWLWSVLNFPSSFLALRRCSLSAPRRRCWAAVAARAQYPHADRAIDALWARQRGSSRRWAAPWHSLGLQELSVSLYHCWPFFFSSPLSVVSSLFHLSHFPPHPLSPSHVRFSTSFSSTHTHTHTHTHPSPAQRRPLRAPPPGLPCAVAGAPFFAMRLSAKARRVVARAEEQQAAGNDAAALEGLLGCVSQPPWERDRKKSRSEHTCGSLAVCVRVCVRFSSSSSLSSPRAS